MINAKAVRHARARAKVTLTGLARATGLTFAQVNDIDLGRDLVLSTITLDKVRRLARALHIDVAALFTPPSGSTRAPDIPTSGASEYTDADDDVRELAAVLITAPTFRPSDIAAALPGWDNERVRTATGALNAVLAPAGLTLHEADNGTRTLAPTAGQSRRPSDLEAVMGAVRGGTPATMSMAYEMLDCPVPESRATYKDLKDRAWLEEAGIVRYDPRLQVTGLTEEAAHGLLRSSAGWLALNRHQSESAS